MGCSSSKTFLLSIKIKYENKTNRISAFIESLLSNFRKKESQLDDAKEMIKKQA
jgi:hypothetical protein